MNRRAFLSGLLCTAAAIPLAKIAAPDLYADLACQINAMRDLDWRYAIGAANAPYGVIGPVSYNGETCWAVGRTLWWMDNNK